MAVVMVCGPPASGKSTLSKKLYYSPEVVYLNRDTEGGTIAQLLPKLESHLKTKTDVVLDNLFPTIESRKPFIELCKTYKTSISCQLMTTPIEDCTFNVVQRSFSLIGKFPSPEEIKKAKHTNIFPPAVLFKYKKEFQKPTTDEGFFEVIETKFVRKDDPTFTNKAVILDYDGTLRECIGGNGKFPVSKDQIEIKSNRKEILESYKKKGYLLLGISNQSGVHKGEITYDKCVELFDYTNKLLEVDIEYKFCTHQSAPISCYCRKPQVGLFVDFMIKHKLSRKDSIFVGDMTTDRTAASRFGCQYIDQAEFFK
jgi:D-glycero-D-manno-heptose 1,7-bisphosphate phosphatase